MQGPLPIALVDVPFWDGGGAAALAALDPRLQWWAEPPHGSELTPLVGAVSGGPPKWALVMVPPYSPPAAISSLTAAFQEVNFNPSALVKGTLQAFTAAGQPFAVPVALAPTGLQCNAQAFQEAGVPLPAPGWTVDEFKQTCLGLQVAIGAGRVKAASTVLPPLVGSTTWHSGRGTATWLGALIDPSTWGAFVLGYGGYVVNAAGQFDLTNAGAVRGLQELLAITLAYGAPVQDLPDSDAAARAPVPAAMTFAPYFWYSVPYHRVHWVPFPRFPVRPVVPVTPTGVNTALLLSGTRLPFSLEGSPNPREVPLQALVAGVVYAQWLYERTGADPTLTGLPPPVAADAPVQDAYWRARGKGGLLLDWRDLVVVTANWPTTPPEGSTYRGFAYTKADLLVFQALTDAAVSKTPLPGLLATTTKALNAAAAAAAPGASHSAGGAGA